MRQLLFRIFDILSPPPHPHMKTRKNETHTFYAISNEGDQSPYNCLVFYLAL